MNWLPFRSVRARLWTALALLSFAVVCISAVMWVSLERVDSRLQELHRQTLSQVAQALALSKRSTDLATSAPYLLNQRSNFLINQEGQKLILALESVRIEWPTSEFGEGGTDADRVSPAIDQLSSGVTDLVVASTALETIQTELRHLTSALGSLRDRASEEIEDQRVGDRERLIWWTLQSMASDALNAAHAGNMIGVGEEHRRFLSQRRSVLLQELTPEQLGFFDNLGGITDGPNGVFEQRRLELSTNLRAQNALFRIRHDAGLISDAASSFAANAERFLSQERDSSSSTIQLTKLVVVAIALASLLLALVSALYVSRYVTLNMAKISSAMVQLAQGDRTSALPRKVTNRDEIGDLFRSFRSFRANALRLDRSNRQLNQRNTLFQKVFTNISDGIAITDATGRVTAQNPAMESILETPPDGSHVGSFVDMLKEGRFGQSARQAGLSDDHRGYCELHSDDGRLVELRASRLPDEGRVWLCVDVTERRKLVDRLQQIDRIETLGKVAGDTAHDFGNILSTINTHVHLLDHLDDKKTKATLSAINNAIEYGSSLTQRLLAFAKKQHLTPEITDLNALVAGMVDLVEISLKSEVKLDVQFFDQPILVLVDLGQLESSLLNLILNGNQAIGKAGKILITLGVTNNRNAFVQIEDTGAGMPREVLNRILEPFYTTRSQDGGTGLGLSIAYGFFRQSGGDLKISSELGKGTQIMATLPLAESPDHVVPKSQDKLVLLVEDDQEARNRAKAILETFGAKVTQASNGEEAQTLLQSGVFDLIVTDLDLGSETGGWELVDQFKFQRPQNHAVVVSGRLPEVLSPQLENDEKLHCLSKPLNIQALGQVLILAFGQEETGARRSPISSPSGNAIKAET